MSDTSKFAIRMSSPLLGAVPLARLRPEQISDAYAKAMASGRRKGDGGLSPRTVLASERLGHSKVGITLDLYSHVLPNMQADAAAVVDGAPRAVLEKRGTKG